ncbi:MAG TPA: MgtC/SapB family protein, partial [Bacillota bacterium]|nr:MgtC/SapB family protein [Bacillota bacterium]
LVTSRNKVKGLTTAAGLWASACIGLALGIGFYAGALIAGTLIFIVLALLPRLEVYFYNRSRVMEIYAEVDSTANMREFLHLIRKNSITIIETHINKTDTVNGEGYSLNMSIRIPKKLNHIEIIELLSTFPGVFLVEELE